MDTILREFLSHTMGWGLIFSTLAKLEHNLLQRAAFSSTVDHAEALGRLRGVEDAIRAMKLLQSQTSYKES